MAKIDVWNLLSFDSNMLLMLEHDPGTADKSISDLLRCVCFDIESNFFRESMALFCMLVFFMALKMFIKLENDPPLGSRLSENKQFSTITYLEME
jgi:hypothetical protein